MVHTSANLSKALLVVALCLPSTTSSTGIVLAHNDERDAASSTDGIVQSNLHRREQVVGRGRNHFENACVSNLLSTAVTRDNLISRDEFAAFLHNYCVGQQICNPTSPIAFEDLPADVQLTFYDPNCQLPTCQGESTDVGYLYTPATQARVSSDIRQMCSAVYPLLTDFVAATAVPSVMAPIPPTPPTTSAGDIFVSSCRNGLLSPAVRSDSFLSQAEYANYLRTYCISQQNCDSNVPLTFNDLPGDLQNAFSSQFCRAPFCNSGDPDVGYLITPATRAAVETAIQQLCITIYASARLLTNRGPTPPSVPRFPTRVPRGPVAKVPTAPIPPSFSFQPSVSTEPSVSDIPSISPSNPPTVQSGGGAALSTGGIIGVSFAAAFVVLVCLGAFLLCCGRRPRSKRASRGSNQTPPETAPDDDVEHFYDEDDEQDEEQDDDEEEDDEEDEEEDDDEEEEDEEEDEDEEEERLPSSVSIASGNLPT